LEADLWLLEKRSDVQWIKSPGLGSLFCCGTESFESSIRILLLTDKCFVDQPFKLLVVAVVYGGCYFIQDIRIV